MAAAAPVELRALSHALGRGEHRRQVLRGVDARIAAGEIVIVTGPSGSGKTTLLTLVGALRSAQEGSLRVLGEELFGSPPRVLERVRRRSGIAGAVAASGTPVRVDDAYADPRFNPEIDQRTGFRTRSILALPVRDREGRVFGVAQLLNRRDGRPFDASDEERFTSFTARLGVILESWQRLDRWSRSRG
jgi:energy-coupling factor transporter ATP-binding protein EcfA2